MAILEPRESTFRVLELYRRTHRVDLSELNIVFGAMMFCAVTCTYRNSAHMRRDTRSHSSLARYSICQPAASTSTPLRASWPIANSISSSSVRPIFAVRSSTFASSHSRSA